MQQTKWFSFEELNPKVLETAVAHVGRLPVGANVVAGTILGSVGGTAQSEVRTLYVNNGSGGSINLSYTADMTYGPITLAYNANASQVQTALLAIFGGSAANPNVAVTGSAGSLSLTFQNFLADVRIGGAFTIDASALTGSSPSANLTNVTRGSAGAGQLDVYSSSNTDGTQVPTAVLKRNYISDPLGGCVNEWGAAGQPDSAKTWLHGDFRVGDLTGFNATCVSSGWAKYAVGNATSGPEAVIRI